MHFLYRLWKLQTGLDILIMCEESSAIWTYYVSQRPMFLRSASSPSWEVVKPLIGKGYWTEVGSMEICPHCFLLMV